MTGEPGAAEQDLFERQRPRLRGLAYRMLGSLAEAEDVVQETWLRWAGADRRDIHRPEAWLATVAGRLALDRLRSCARSRETYPGPWLPEPVVSEPGPEEMAELADSLTLGFLVLLDRLSPLERAVFVLADVFDVPFADIAPAVGRSEVACRQIASRARRRVRSAPGSDAADRCRPHGQTAGGSVPNPDRELLDGLILAVGLGDIGAVVSRLAPDVVCVSDGGPFRRAARRPVVGPSRVARLLINLAARYAGRLHMAPVSVNGSAGYLLYLDGQIDQVMAVDTDRGAITAIRVMRNPEKLALLGHAPPLE